MYSSKLAVDSLGAWRKAGYIKNYRPILEAQASSPIASDVFKEYWAASAISLDSFDVLTKGPASMKTPQVISFHCVLTNRLGHHISSSVQGEVINSAEHSGHLKDLALGLQDVKAGDRRKIFVTAERAYGLYDPDLVGEIPRADLSSGAKLKVGDVLQLYSPERRCSLPFKVIEATSEVVVFDGNHPLAGQDLCFDVEIIEARELRKEDVPLISLSSPHNKIAH